MCVEIGVVLRRQLLRICECDLPVAQAIAYHPGNQPACPVYSSLIKLPLSADTGAIEGMVEGWESEGTAN